MSNRLLGILIIFLIGIGGFFYWTFVYIPNKQAEDEKIRQEQELQAQKETINLVQVNEREVVSVEENSVSNGEITEELNGGISNYKTINIGNKKFVFSIIDNNLGLYLNEKLVSTFLLVPENLLDVQRIYSSDDEYYILVGDRKYLYSELTDILAQFDLNIQINYMKKINSVFLINTIKGTFLYDRNKDSTEYIDIFEDFVYYNDGYVGVLKSSDTRRIKNLGLNSLNNNAIFYYNPTTKEKESLYETGLNLTKIYLVGDEIYFEENGVNIYKLKNY